MPLPGEWRPAEAKPDRSSAHSARASTLPRVAVRRGRAGERLAGAGSAPASYPTTSYPAGRFPGLYRLPGSSMRSTTLSWTRAPSGIFRVRLPRTLQNPS